MAREEARGTQDHQGGALAAVSEADRRGLGVDGDMRARDSRWRVGWLAASRKFGPTPNLSGLLRIVGRDSAEIIVGRSFRLSRVNLSS